MRADGSCRLALWRMDAFAEDRVMGVVMRLGVVLALLAVAGVMVWAPWKTPAAERVLLGTDGEPIADDGSFTPVPGVGSAPPHELVRYNLPEPKTVPALPEGVSDLNFVDLWADGSLAVREGTERVGTPDETLFPEGTTAEDMMLFFLDLADMRSLQPQEGGIRPELDGKRVRIAGYTTPVGFGETDKAFLLVPELGACIHVPPPPPNQIVYVAQAAGEPEMFEPVWITGTLRADPVATILADVGYRMEEVVAQPYR